VKLAGRARWITEAGIATRQLRGSVLDWPVEWDDPAIEGHDRESECRADMAERRAGFTTHARIVRRRGYDPKTTLDELEREERDFKRRELKLDSDANVTTSAGAVQTQAAPANSKSAE